MAGIRALSDLPALFASAGCEPLWTETLAAARPAVEVARSGDLSWLAFESANPAADARRAARHLARRGRAAGVAALDTLGRRLALAIGLDAIAWREVRLDAPDAADLVALSRLAAPGESALAAALRAHDALATEGAGTRFFRALRGTLERMEGAFARGPTADERRTLALLQVTRVLFLYFVQSKGWLDGRSDFLARAVDATLAGRRHLARDLLRPLFFGTLNRPAHERGRIATRFGAVPFLNGGLFEPHALERRWATDLPNDIWRDVFDSLFERFRFTTAEGRDHAAVAPDMLGRAFEGVMRPEARRTSGTFYTPAALVRRMVNEGAAALVARRLRLGDGEALRQLELRSPAAAGVLREATILDPAAGSGAFLLGALELLTALRAAEGERQTAARRAVLRANIFGVDLSATAVRLAELRLWLAVVADDPSERAGTVAPLPNLDCLVRQGDSLTDPLGTTGAIGGAEPALVEAVARARHALVTASGPAKRRAARELRAVETALALAQLGASERRTDGEVRELLAAARERTLFGERRGLDPALAARLTALRARRRVVRALARRVSREGELPWFSYETHFGDVVARGGFDLVVGNPPWVRAELVPAALRERLAERYRWWRGSGGGRGYAHRPDLAVAFIERAIELAAPDGVVALVVPAKLATAAWGTACRHGLTAATRLHTVADLAADPDAAFDATVYPLALVASRGGPPRGCRVRTQLGGSQTVPQSRLSGGGPWVLTRSALARLASRIAGRHPALGEHVRAQLGVKTGANELFVTGMDQPVDVEPDLLRPAIRGRDVIPFDTMPRRHIIWTHDSDGAPLDVLPPLAHRWFARHRDRLLARTDHDGGPPWRLFRTEPAQARHRVVWADLARRLAAAYLPGGSGTSIPLNSCYVSPMPSAERALALAAWLNASPVTALARVGAVPASGGFARFTARAILAIPCPSGVLADPALARLGREGQRRGATAVQEELDDRALAHLGLSRRERRAVADALAGQYADPRR